MDEGGREMLSDAKLLVSQAQTATDEQRWSDAAVFWSQACDIHPDNVGFHLSHGEALVKARRFDEAAAIFNKVQRTYPNDLRALSGLINIAQETLDRETALQHLHRGIERHNQPSGAIRKVIRLLVELGRVGEAETTLTERGAQMTPVDLLLANADVLRNGRGSALMAMIEHQRELVMSTPLLQDLLPEILLEIGEVDQAVAVWLGPDPSPVRRARGQLMLASRTTKWGDTANTELFHSLWKRYRFSVFSVEDFSLIFNAVRTMEGEVASIEMLCSIDRRPPVHPIDLKLKVLALFEGAAVGQVDDLRNALYQIVHDYRKDNLLENFTSLIDHILSKVDIASANFSSVNLETGVSRQSACALLDYLLTSYEQSRPLSLIRLGDGEGIFLPYPQEYEGFSASDREAAQIFWWGKVCFDHVTTDMISRELIGVIRRADVIGIHDLKFWCRVLPVKLGGPLYLKNSFFRGMLSLLDNAQIYCHDKSMCDTKMLTSSFFPFDFESHGLYDRLFSVIREVSVITCHAKLAPYLQERFGVMINSISIIPSEAQRSSAFRSSEPMDDHYPHFFLRLKQDLLQRNSRRQITLVAAGFLGKFYCDWIKQSGGIAIDIGSLADYWCGFSTRHPSHSRVLRNIPAR